MTINSSLIYVIVYYSHFLTIQVALKCCDDSVVVSGGMTDLD